MDGEGEEEGETAEEDGAEGPGLGALWCLLLTVGGCFEGGYEEGVVAVAETGLGTGPGGKEVGGEHFASLPWSEGHFECGLDENESRLSVSLSLNSVLIKEVLKGSSALQTWRFVRIVY